MLLTRLKYWRELRGYSLRELAGKSKVPYSAISLLENGKREPQGRTARKLAAALDVEVADLYDQAPAAQEPKYTASATSKR
jgi:transcriptional regulator with XRE-family HTH domain